VFQHPVEVVDQVVAGVVQVAGVEADPHLFLQRDAVEDAAEFLEAAPDFAALAGHCFEQHRRVQFRRQHRVELVDDQRDAGLFALSDVAAGVKVVEVARQPLHARQVVKHRFQREIARFRVGRTRVERVGSVRQQLAETVFGGQREKGVDVALVEILGLAAAWVAREELECVGADRQRVAAHAEEAVGR